MKAVSASSIAVCDQVYCDGSGWVRRCGTTTFITRTRRVPFPPENLLSRWLGWVPGRQWSRFLEGCRIDPEYNGAP
jgi:hypothetical protein